MGRKQWTDEKLFDRLSNNRSDSTYWDNVRELRSRPNNHVFEKAVELTNSKQPKDRKTGVNILAQLGVSPRPFYDTTIVLFFNILEKETDTDIIEALLYAIGHNNSVLNNEQIEKICSFKDFIYKESLVSASLGIDNEKAIDTLIYLSENTSANVRNWATFGIGTQIERDTVPIREALWKRIKDKNEDTKFEAIAGLAKRRDKKVISIIQKELMTENYQGLLYEAITSMNDTQFIPILKEHFNKNKSNTDINPQWLNDLKNCIDSLE